MSRIRTDGRRATGVDFIGPDGVERSMDARYVVVAGGAVETPRLLLLSGIDHPLIGRHLMVHFQTIVVGGSRRPAPPRRTGPGRHRVHDDALVPDDASRAAAKEAGLPWMRGGMVEHGGRGPAHPRGQDLPVGSGPQVEHAVVAHARAACGPSPCRGRTCPVATNRIDLDPTVRDVRGLPGGPVTYRPAPPRAGRLGPPRPPAGRRSSRRWAPSGRPSSPRRARPAARGTDPEHAPDEPARHGHGPDGGRPRPPRWPTRDGRLHELPNVVIADSSLFVTSSGYGPTLTLAALAARSAAAMA